MGHRFAANKVHDVVKQGDDIIIQLEYCNHNDVCDYLVTAKNDQVNLFEKFKKGTCVVTNCHECYYDEENEGDSIKIVRAGFFEETEKADGKFPETVEFKHSWDFKADKPIVPEDEVLVIPA